MASSNYIPIESMGSTGAVPSSSRGMKKFSRKTLAAAFAAVLGVALLGVALTPASELERMHMRVMNGGRKYTGRMASLEGMPMMPMVPVSRMNMAMNMGVHPALVDIRARSRFPFNPHSPARPATAADLAAPRTLSETQIEQAIFGRNAPRRIPVSVSAASAPAHGHPSVINVNRASYDPESNKAQIDRDLFMMMQMKQNARKQQHVVNQLNLNNINNKLNTYDKQADPAFSSSNVNDVPAF